MSSWSSTGRVARLALISEAMLKVISRGERLSLVRQLEMAPSRFASICNGGERVPGKVLTCGNDLELGDLGTVGVGAVGSQNQLPLRLVCDECAMLTRTGREDILAGL